MSILYVVSDNARAGKTAFSASLTSVLNDIGHNVTISKLIFSDNEKSGLNNYSTVLDSSLTSSSNESIDLKDAAQKIKVQLTKCFVRTQTLHEELKNILRFKKVRDFLTFL